MVTDRRSRRLCRLMWSLWCGLVDICRRFGRNHNPICRI